MRNLIQTPLIVLAVSFLVMWISARIGAYGHKWFNLDEDTLKDLDLIVPATLTLPRPHHWVQLFDGHQSVRSAQNL